MLHEAGNAMHVHVIGVSLMWMLGTVRLSTEFGDMDFFKRAYSIIVGKPSDRPAKRAQLTTSNSSSSSASRVAAGSERNTDTGRNRVA